jgi:hypothetical protein
MQYVACILLCFVAFYMAGKKVNSSLNWVSQNYVFMQASPLKGERILFC